MASYSPTFPFIGNQIILTSDRVTLLADEDAVFVFGNKAVSLSSKNTVNLDATNKIILSSPIINLGSKNADTLGEPVILGKTLISLLSELVKTLQDFLSDAGSVKYSDLSTLRGMADSANNASDLLDDIVNAINNSTLSTNVFITSNKD
jgi:hypothetical protein